MSSPLAAHSPPTATCPAKTVSRLSGIGLVALVFLLSLLAIVILQERAGSHSAELSGYPDEPAHYITGLAFRGYLLGGWKSESPVNFVENFYLHYPKVAIGHWPPGYYFVQFFWTVLFPTTISSLLYLQAVLLAATSAVLFSMARSRFGPLAAGVLCAVFLILYPTQELASEMMSEPLLAFVTLLASWAIASYFETGRWTFIIGFVLLAEMAIHTKGSGLALVGAPLMLAIFLRRRDEFRKWIFWGAQLAIFAILAPWQIFTWKMVRNGMTGGVTVREVATQTYEFGLILVKIFGWPLLAIVVCGVCLALVSRKSRDPLLVSCAVTAMLTLVLHCISPNGAESRRLFMAVPNALILAALPVWLWVKTPNLRAWRPAILLALVTVSVLPSLAIYRKAAVGYRPVADWLLANATPGGDAILIASDIDGEGMLISEIGQRQPKPSLYIVRSTKLFENCDWNYRDCRSTVTGPLQAQQVVDSIPIDYVVVDRFPGIASNSSTELLRSTIAAQPGFWALRKTQEATAPGTLQRGEILIYQRLGLTQTDHVHLQVDLRRMIGRVIGQ
jgi:hypothetical protein